MLERVMEATAGVRLPGAASLDLAYVAAGRLDGFWEVGLSPWDTAAGNLLITEAGGRVGNLAGGEYRDGGNLLAGTPRVFAALAELFSPMLDEELRK
jgi:myo-inositol-1(or 4)-monophosphatase